MEAEFTAARHTGDEAFVYEEPGEERGKYWQTSMLRA